MIPTRSRAKLPRTLSYPVGAGVVSEALDGAPHVEGLSISFRDLAVWPASQFRRVLAERSPYRILEVRFDPARKPGLCAANFLIERGWYEEKWEMIVYPVLLEFRHLANGLVRAVALPAVEAWLVSSGRAGWDAARRDIAFVFDPVARTLLPETSQGV